jgi:glycosyltransferase involved in cell wall biosynthesis
MTEPELVAQNQALQARIAEMEATRVWRLGLAYWRLRDTFKAFWESFKKGKGLQGMVLEIEQAHFTYGRIVVRGWVAVPIIGGLEKKPLQIAVYHQAKLLAQSPCILARPELDSQYTWPYKGAIYGFKLQARYPVTEESLPLELRLSWMDGPELHEHRLTLKNEGGQIANEDLLHEALKAFGPAPYILDLGGTYPLELALPEAQIFQAPNDDWAYLPATVEIVACLPQADQIATAQRIAQYQVWVYDPASNQWEIIRLNTPSRPALPVIKARPEKGEILICLHLMPEFKHVGGHRRTYEIIQVLQAEGYKLSLYIQELLPNPFYLQLWREMGVSVYGGGVHSKGVEKPDLISFKDLAALCQPRLILVVHWFITSELLPDLRAHFAGVPVWIDSLDLGFINHARRTFVKKPPLLLDVEYGRNVQNELNTYRQAEGVVAISQKEADYLIDLLAGTVPCQVVVDTVDFPEDYPPFAERRGMCFVGVYNYAPNLDSLRWIIEEVLPHVPPSLLAEHPFYVIGAYLPSNDIARWSAGPYREYVRVLGWVPSILPYLLACRLSLAPLRYGAGTKNKVIAAMGAGLPCVTNHVGAEGLNLAREALAIAETPQGLADHITRLLQDESQWEQLSQAGRAYTQAYHSRAAMKQALLPLLEALP